VIVADLAFLVLRATSPTTYRCCEVFYRDASNIQSGLVMVTVYSTEVCGFDVGDFCSHGLFMTKNDHCRINNRLEY
jgi:hypothetical protein